MGFACVLSILCLLLLSKAVVYSGVKALFVVFILSLVDDSPDYLYLVVMLFWKQQRYSEAHSPNRLRHWASPDNSVRRAGIEPAH